MLCGIYEALYVHRCMYVTVKNNRGHTTCTRSTCLLKKRSQQEKYMIKSIALRTCVCNHNHFRYHACFLLFLLDIPKSSSPIFKFIVVVVVVVIAVADVFFFFLVSGSVFLFEQLVRSWECTTYCLGLVRFSPFSIARGRGVSLTRS